MPYLLSNLGFIAIDCQATGPHPRKGDLVELGWAVQQPRRQQRTFPAVSVANCLVRPEQPLELTRQFHRVTGISSDFLNDAIPPAEAWHALRQSACDMAAAQKRSKCLALIHYARYEMPFLNDLHIRYSDKGCFPFDVICTHEICRRAFPDLPRRGLRAIAGFLGYSIPPIRRAALHATATVSIWRHLVALLRDVYGVRTLNQLHRWLTISPTPTDRQRSFPMPPPIRKNIPDRPGVYHMLRQDGSILYIGKSRSLKQRVNQYFQKKARHPEHILEMLTQAGDIATFPTHTALEAALLESDHIKHHAPPYNIALQLRDRTLCYVSGDLHRVSSELNYRHPIGPLPDPSVAVAMTAVRHLTELWQLNRLSDCPISPNVIMAIPEAYAPESDVFWEGLQLFFKRNQDGLQQRLIGRCLIKLGEQLWQKRVGSPNGDSSQDENDAKDANETDSPAVWTADRVASGIESILWRGAHWMRRARWFGLISEATLVWETGPADPAPYIGIVLHSGQVVERIGLSAEEPIPAPPAYNVDPVIRRQGIDLITYDRLRILTTELRRVMAQGRRVQVQLSPTRLLNDRALHRILQIV